MNLIQNNWENPESHDRLEIVFSGRNKNFGAYAIRKNYERNVLLALLFTCSAGIFLALLPRIHNYFFPSSGVVIHGKPEIEVIFETYFPEQKTDPVIPPPIQPIPIKPIGPPFPSSIPLVVDSTVHDDLPPQNPTTQNPPSTGNNIDTTILAEIPDLPISGNGLNKEEIPIYVPEMPSFFGGEKALLTYLASHLHYPESARRNSISGIVYISFIINQDGKVMDAEIEKGIDYYCDQEALRVISGMPNWKPGRQNGHTVMVKYVLPVKYTLKD